MSVAWSFGMSWSCAPLVPCPHDSVIKVRTLDALGLAFESWETTKLHGRGTSPT
jgi:hypothetical protein